MENKLKLLNLSAATVNVTGCLLYLFTQDKPNLLSYLALYSSSVHLITAVSALTTVNKPVLPLQSPNHLTRITLERENYLTSNSVG